MKSSREQELGTNDPEANDNNPFSTFFDSDKDVLEEKSARKAPQLSEEGNASDAFKSENLFDYDAVIIDREFGRQLEAPITESKKEITDDETKEDTGTVAKNRAIKSIIHEENSARKAPQLPKGGKASKSFKSKPFLNYTFENQIYRNDLRGTVSDPTMIFNVPSYSEKRDEIQGTVDSIAAQIVEAYNATANDDAISENNSAINDAADLNGGGVADPDSVLVDMSNVSSQEDEDSIPGSRVCKDCLCGVIVHCQDGREKMSKEMREWLEENHIYGHCEDKTVETHVDDDRLQIYITWYSWKATDLTTNEIIYRIPYVFILKKFNRGKLNSQFHMFKAADYLIPNWEYNIHKDTAKGNAQNRIVYFVDTGTKPCEGSLLDMKHFLDSHPYVGGVCGEIVPEESGCCLSKVASSQIWIYKYGHCIDKPYDDQIGYLTVVPGAFCALRWEALHKWADNVEPWSRDLPTARKKYFEPLEGRAQNLQQSNANTAEDRKLSFLLPLRGWSLRYLSETKALVDIPLILHDLVYQWRRWINGHHASTYDLFSHFQVMMMYPRPKVDGLTIHQKVGCWLRFYFLKIALFVMFVIKLISELASMLAPLFLVVMLSFGVEELRAILLFPEWAEFVLIGLANVVFVVAPMLTTLMIGLSANKLSRTAKQAYLKSVSSLLGVASGFVLLAASSKYIFGIDHYFEKKSFNTTSNATEMRFIKSTQEIAEGSILVAVFAIALTALLNTGLQGIWVLFFRFYSYVTMAPTYSVIMQIFSICNIDDVGWGIVAGKTASDTVNMQTEIQQGFSQIKVVFLLCYILLNVTVGIMIFSAQYHRNLMDLVCIIGSCVVVFKCCVAIMYAVDTFLYKLEGNLGRRGYSILYPIMVAVIFVIVVAAENIVVEQKPAAWAVTTIWTFVCCFALGFVFWAIKRTGLSQNVKCHQTRVRSCPETKTYVKIFYSISVLIFALTTVAHVGFFASIYSDRAMSSRNTWQQFFWAMNAIALILIVCWHVAIVLYASDNFEPSLKILWRYVLAVAVILGTIDVHILILAGYKMQNFLPPWWQLVLLYTFASCAYCFLGGCINLIHESRLRWQLSLSWCISMCIVNLATFFGNAVSLCHFVLSILMFCYFFVRETGKTLDNMNFDFMNRNRYCKVNMVFHAVLVTLMLVAHIGFWESWKIRHENLVITGPKGHPLLNGLWEKVYYDTGKMQSIRNRPVFKREINNMTLYLSSMFKDGTESLPPCNRCSSRGADIRVKNNEMIWTITDNEWDFSKYSWDSHKYNIFWKSEAWYPQAIHELDTIWMDKCILGLQSRDCYRKEPIVEITFQDRAISPWVTFFVAVNSVAGLSLLCWCMVPCFPYDVVPSEHRVYVVRALGFIVLVFISLDLNILALSSFDEVWWIVLPASISTLILYLCTFPPVFSWICDKKGHCERLLLLISCLCWWLPIMAWNISTRFQIPILVIHFVIWSIFVLAIVALEIKETIKQIGSINHSFDLARPFGCFIVVAIVCMASHIMLFSTEKQEQSQVTITFFVAMNVALGIFLVFMFFYYLSHKSVDSVWFAIISPAACWWYLYSWILLYTDSQLVFFVAQSNFFWFWALVAFLSAIILPCVIVVGITKLVVHMFMNENDGLAIFLILVKIGLHILAIYLAFEVLSLEAGHRIGGDKDVPAKLLLDFYVGSYFVTVGLGILYGIFLCFSRFFSMWEEYLA